MGCENNFEEEEEDKRTAKAMMRLEKSEPRAGMDLEKTSQTGPSLVLFGVKVGKGKYTQNGKILLLWPYNKSSTDSPHLLTTIGTSR